MAASSPARCAIGHGSSLRYVRRYPDGALFGHPIGYSFARQGDSEFEQSHNEELVGTSSEFGSILDQLSGRNQEGDDVVTNLDPTAQRVALNALAGDRLRSGGGDRAADRPGAGDGVQPSLQPQPGSL